MSQVWGWLTRPSWHPEEFGQSDAPNTVIGILKFSALFEFASEGLTEFFAADEGAIAGGQGAESLGTAPHYFLRPCRIQGLHLVTQNNTMAIATTFSLYKNGVATAASLSIGAGTNSVVADGSGTIIAFNGTTDFLGFGCLGGNSNGTVFACATCEVLPP
ncbi:MAG TPA: hypothetical protein VES65_11435 [Solirubrobacteraceae bacterium]|nr:hypothetical protein [Solirubrobacteraceae bacterium]